MCACVCVHCVCVCVCVCLCVRVCKYALLAYHCSCVEPHEAGMADLNTKLKKTEEKLHNATKCENNHNAELELFFTI